MQASENILGYPQWIKQSHFDLIREEKDINCTCLRTGNISSGGRGLCERHLKTGMKRLLWLYLLLIELEQRPGKAIHDVSHLVEHTLSPRRTKTSLSMVRAPSTHVYVLCSASTSRRCALLTFIVSCMSLIVGSACSGLVEWIWTGLTRRTCRRVVVNGEADNEATARVSHSSVLAPLPDWRLESPDKKGHRPFRRRAANILFLVPSSSCNRWLPATNGV